MAKNPGIPFAQDQDERSGPKLSVTIEAVAFGGDGLARHDGKVIFVPDAIPEESLEIEILKDHGRFAHGRRLRTLQPAPYSQENPCPYAELCGGCQWLHVPYERQLAWKKSFIAAAFQKFAKVEWPSSWPIVAAPQTAGYRNRIKIKLQHLPSGSFRWGYYAKGSHTLVPIKHCWIAADPINKVLQAFSELNCKAPQQGALYELELQHLPGTDDQVTAAFLPPAPDSFIDRLREASAQHPILGKRLIWSKANDPARIFEEDRNLTYHTHAGQFQQVNREANHYLRAWIERKALALGAERIVDLFCGSGNLSLGLAQAGSQVWGLEVGEAAIAAAAQNVSVNELDTAQYACGLAHHLHAIYPDLKGQSIDLVLVDPPRKGMAEALESVLSLKAPHLIYVSCDPNTLARDLRTILEAGYTLKDGLGLDFFPHSYHVETVVHLSLLP